MHFFSKATITITTKTNRNRKMMIGIINIRGRRESWSPRLNSWRVNVLGLSVRARKRLINCANNIKLKFKASRTGWSKRVGSSMRKSIKNCSKTMRSCRKSRRNSVSAKKKNGYLREPTESFKSTLDSWNRNSGIHSLKEIDITHRCNF